MTNRPDMDHLPERITAVFPADDPLFAEVRAYLGQLRRRGRDSGSARAAGWLAMLGYQVLTQGGLGGAVELPQGVLPDPQELASLNEHVGDALGGLSFD